MKRHHNHSKHHNHGARVLFICKHRHLYGHKVGLSSGLFNSAKFVSDMLTSLGIESKIVDVIDNNCIDKEVHSYKPTHVFIEALWVVPEKFDILTKLHPKVKWIIRLHSEIPFISMEGIAMHWIFEYAKKKNVIVSINSKRAQSALEYELKTDVPYLPNYYPITYEERYEINDTEYLDIGCFGAIRPFKNHLNQAMAAIEFAESIGKKLRFHINHERVEGWSSDSILKNLEYLFYNKSPHELVEHLWMPHNEFAEFIKYMDLGMQVSFTETFNIVTADLVNCGVPVVVSPEVSWASCLYKADPTSIPNMIKKLKFAWDFKKYGLHYLNKIGLVNYNNHSKEIWANYILNKND